tara:strand:- start:3464 stop:4003 length:540 start_codon:yes stop_codon:yes gene_type:complete
MTVRNSNAPEGWITTFKDLGTFIAIYDELVSGNLAVQTKLTAAVEQQDYDYGTVKSLSTFINNMVSASTNLDTAKTNLISASTNYLTTVTAVDINSTATTASGVIADMIQGMQGATTGAAISGLQVLSGGHFHTYFADEYGITLPVTSGSIYVAQSESMDMISGTLPALRRQIDDSYGD